MNTRIPILAALALWFATAGIGFPQVGGGQVAVWMAYRNDSKFTIAVQTSYVVNGQQRRGSPHLMNPREAASDQVFAATQKTITVYDPKTARELGRLVVPGGGKDLFFLIQVEAGANNTPGRATVVPIADPRTVPGGFPGATR
jgi:hypothetical protein